MQKSLVEKFGSLVTLAWRSELDFSELLNSTAEMDVAGLPHLSAVLYQTWLSRNVSPYAHLANFNLGATLTNLNDLAGAEAAYRRAIAMAGDFTHPHLNLGLLLERAGKHVEAVAQWQWIVDNARRDDVNLPLVVLALNHLGRVQEGLKQLLIATEHLTESLRLDPNQPDVLHHWVFLRQKQCAWPVYDTVPGVSIAAMREATSALAMLSISDDPNDQLHAAQQFVETKVAKNLPNLSVGRHYGHKKIRIGYCSSDFSLHPVSMLTAELYELHDREAFEVFGYCWSPEDGSGLRSRVRSAIEHFTTVHSFSDEDVARLIARDEIDILVDLQGQTAGARPNIFAYRPAPIQITYLGLPATTGFPFIDYVIADKFLIPAEEACFYSEKPLYMPNVYQVSDRKRLVGTTPTRSSCGLPEYGFVFCSFNNSYKYTPEVFNVWLNLLEGVPDSVLWLLADNPWAEANLRSVASLRGVAPDRLVFATRALPPDYLARYCIADLFLDTFPFNAGTTANDCLWMGCPLLTMTGRSFGARMAGALLTAAGLPELITYSLSEYETVARTLAMDPDRCSRLRQTLCAVKERGVLFDTSLFVHDLELRFKQLVEQLPKLNMVDDAHE
jgi:predicted O-linked N-acetylglucosamine transferase (SPINDLY family)